MQPTMTLEQIEDFILERLPQVLERDPRFVTFIEGIVAEKFPRRDEFARLLDEVQQHRKETAEQFGHVEQQIQEHRTETAEQFQRVDQRFEQVDQQIQQHRTETTEQFKRVDQRFEQVDQRFEQVDQRFEQVDQRFEQVDQRFEQVDQRFDKLENRMAEGFRNVQSSIDRLGQRWGIRNEALFRQTMREVLEKSFGATVEERYLAGEQFDYVIIDSHHILVEISASVGQDILKKLQRKRQLYIEETGVTPARFLLAVGTIHSRRANALREAGFEVIEPETDDA